VAEKETAAPGIAKQIPRPAGVMPPRRCTPDAAPDEHIAASVRTSLAGLALSGGGIRSATFALGALQALAKANMLGVFDFCSTVSGGGFTGGWWSAWLSRPERQPADGFFPEDERLEPDRYPAAILDRVGQRIGTVARMRDRADDAPEGSRSVLELDPIHHLRLFSNYLTPRGGALSADTWRAVTVISRNVFLTWLVLIPILLAVVLTGQIYFAGRHDVGYAFACSRPDDVSPPDSATKKPETRKVVQDNTAFCVGALATAKSTRESLLSLRASKTEGLSRQEEDVLHSLNTTIAAGRLPHSAVLQERLMIIGDPLLAAAFILAFFILLWMLYSWSKFWLTLFGLATLGAMILILFQPAWPATGPSFGLLTRVTENRWFTVAAVVATVMLLVLGLRLVFRRIWRSTAEQLGGERRRDEARNVIVRWNARALLAFLLIMFCLLLAGFGHEIAWYLFDPASGTLPAAARKAGGWLAIVLMVGSTALTVAKAFPSPKGNDAANETPSWWTRLAMSVAPPLVLLGLTIGCAAFGRWILSTRTEWQKSGYPEVSNAATTLMVGAGLLAVFAATEAYSVDEPTASPGRSSIGRRGRFIAILLLFAAMGFSGYLGLRGRGDWQLAVAFSLLSLSVAAVVLRASQSLRTTASLLGAALVGVLSTFGTQWWLSKLLVADAAGRSGSTLYYIAVGTLIVIVVALVADWTRRSKVSQRSTALGALALWCAFSVVLLHHLPHMLAPRALVTTAAGWIGFLIAWVVGFGWTLDPNVVALHNFYRARIVRAYLGASNFLDRQNRRITEAAPNDDILLMDLANHCQGAPIQLINTTLNLVGGGDLATAQRSAALFTMSSEVCGSARTGYRRTAEYMEGTLSLGTAVAASGAAVSATMGSKSVSSALALLLALFNVRLGYWAPTPNQRQWRDRQPRLWPYYLLTEALSQTNDLGSYCYLTDGGHFDNTGIYALVERGCQYIMVLDDGADPRPCFSDMGDAIRRCRIDFGAEIDLQKGVDAFSWDEKLLASDHCVMGDIAYAATHLRMLGWTESEIRARRPGRIMWVKPTITDKDSVDVRQYRLENKDFPQQTTVDQWYDEAQFESYRVLGYQTMQVRMSKIKPNPENAGTLFV
jgi:hypothetical protein